jgi:diguanylate cyclase (GGDEF)-like protein
MDRTELRGVCHVLWPYLALWVAVACGLAGFAAYEIERHRQVVMEAGRTEADNLAQVMSERMAQVLDGTDRTLTLFKVVIERRLADQPLERLAEAMRPIQGSDAERRVNRFDRDGRLVGSSDPTLTPGSLAIGGQRHFREARAQRDLRLAIGDAMIGQVSGTLIIPVVKRLDTPDGEFDGVVSTVLDPQRLVQLFRALRVGERSAVGIAQREGPVLAFADADARRSPAEAPATLAEALRSGHLIALSAVHGTELVAFALLSEHELLAAHRRFTLATLAFVALTLAAVSVPIGWVGYRAWHDVHHRHSLEQRYASVHQQARTDPLTGLANRTGFDEARRAAYQELKRAGTPFALAFVDIDHFKRLNDHFGHDTGDDALRQVAETLAGGVRQTDVVGRLGGDEFAVLMPGVTSATMHRRFDPIKHDLDQMVSRRGWSISFSIGVVACESATPRERDAVNLADRMMYDAKGSGRNAIRYAVFRGGRLVPESEAASADPEWIEAV